MSVNIVGGGLAGCTMAALLQHLPVKIYEKDRVGGLCIDNKNYQEYVHVFHTNYRDVWSFLNDYTTVRPHHTTVKSYVNGKLKAYPPKKITSEVIKEQIEGYSRKMWKKSIPKEALERITTSEDEYFFHERYEGVPDFTELFKNLTRGVEIVKKDVRDGDLDGLIILTGAIDEYFNYCYGELPYRGMQAVWYEAEQGLEADYYSFSDEKLPFQRVIDYNRFGYEGQWIGIETATDKLKHYPVRDPKSVIIYQKYAKLAKDKGIILAGRLATYHYMDMDDVIKQCFDIARLWNNT